MADDATPIQTDTTTSPSDAAPAAAPQPDTAPVADVGDEGTVLGGQLAPDEPDAPQAEPVTGAPEKYELALEGVNLDPELVAEAEPVLRELNLTNEQANALLPLAPKIMEKAQAATMQAILDAGAQQRKDWLDAFAADPEIGGAKREETEHLAAKGMDALGFAAGHPFRQALTESGFGNHPDMIRVFRRLGEMVGEDGAFVRSNDGVRDAVPIEKRLYPND